MRLIKGLAEKQLISRIRKYDRLSALGERALGFYLLDFEVRGLCRKHGFASTIQFACVRLQMARKRVCELLRMARALEDLPLIDAAFAKGEISWSAVRELTRVAVRETEAEWLELAKTSTLRQIEHAVTGAKRGERPPTDPYTLSRTRLRVVAELDAEDHAIWQAAFERIAVRAGPDLDASTALTQLARAFLEQPITEEESAARKAFQVVYHRCTDCERAWMMSSDGPQGVDAAKIDARARRAEVIRLDERPQPAVQGVSRGVSSIDKRLAVGGPAPGHVQTWVDSGSEMQLPMMRAPRGADRSAFLFLSTPGSPPVPGKERDRPNTALIRQHVLNRDGRSCAVPGCTNKGHLASHHIIWREQGGATTVENEVSVCRTCHSLIHEGFLFVAGRAPNGLRWLSADRKPIVFFASQKTRAVPEYVKEIGLTTHEAAPRGVETCEANPFGDTTIHSLDEVPDEVSAEWWQAHKHNFAFKGNRVFLKSRE